MAESVWKKLESVYRRMSIITAPAYRTISYAALREIASARPLRLEAKQRAFGYEKRDTQANRRQIEEERQED